MRRVNAMVIGCVVSFLAGGGAMWAQQQTATRREPQFENDHVRAWKSIIEPKQPLTLHRHEHGRTLIALVGGTIKIVEANGSSKTVVWETGKAYWLDADPPGQTHADVNDGPKAIEVIVVEMKN